MSSWETISFLSKLYKTLSGLRVLELELGVG